MSEQYLTIKHLTTTDLTRLFSSICVNWNCLYDNSPCWEWTGSQHVGYGYIGWHNQWQLVHRVTYSWLVGPLPIGKSSGEIDHLCRNRRCCNPSHLELVDGTVNLLRGQSPAAQNARKTHCQSGHLFDAANTLISGNHRICRTCHRERQRRYYQANVEDRDNSKATKEQLRARWREATRRYRLRKKQLKVSQT